MCVVALHKLDAHRRFLMLARSLACVLALLCALAGCAPEPAVSRAGFRAKTTGQHAIVRAMAIASPAPVILELDRALLEPVSAVDCVFTGAMSNSPSPAEIRMKLDYEAQCYRQDGMIVRARLQRLQDAVEKMIKAARQRNLMISGQ
jgi:hypothetical protein